MLALFDGLGTRSLSALLHCTSSGGRGGAWRLSLSPGKRKVSVVHATG